MFHLEEPGTLGPVSPSPSSPPSTGLALPTSSICRSRTACGHSTTITVSIPGDDPGGTAGHRPRENGQQVERRLRAYLKGIAMRKRYRLHLQGREHLDRWLVSLRRLHDPHLRPLRVLYSVAIVNKEEYRAVIEGMTRAFNQVPRSDGLLEGRASPCWTTRCRPPLLAGEPGVAISPRRPHHGYASSARWHGPCHDRSAASSRPWAPWSTPAWSSWRRTTTG